MASEKWFRTSALASLSVFVTAAAPAVAADQIGSVGIEDIVVTARRTEENIQTTPVAVTALSTEMIKQAQVGDVAGLQRTAPSLSIATGAPGGSGFVYISIRGMPALNPGVANDPSVATYVDGFIFRVLRRVRPISSTSSGSRSCAAPRARCSVATPPAARSTSSRSILRAISKDSSAFKAATMIIAISTRCSTYHWWAMNWRRASSMISWITTATPAM